MAPASEYRALQNQVRGLQRMLNKKTMENEILREAILRVAGPKKDVAVLNLDCCDREAIGLIATTAGISAADVSVLVTAAIRRRFGRVNRLPATAQ